MITRRVRVEGINFRETLLVMWGNAAARAVDQCAEVVSVQCMVPVSFAQRSWQLTAVTGVWACEAGDNSAPIFKFAGHGGYRDEFLQPGPEPTLHHAKVFPR